MDQIIVALAGNPNVGKSTVFNALTGMHQHTGNWPGKTVSNARGVYHYKDCEVTLVDLPGTYSLFASSVEEEIARDYLTGGEPNLVVCVTDATCLRRNLNLVLQIREITDRIVLCVNLMDEAKKKGIAPDLTKLSAELALPVVGTSARSGKGLGELCESVHNMAAAHPGTIPKPAAPDDSQPLNRQTPDDGTKPLNRQTADDRARRIAAESSRIYAACVTEKNSDPHSLDRRLDRILTSRRYGYPIMLLLLALIFWITISGANYPSALLSRFFTGLEQPMLSALAALHTSDTLAAMLVTGIYRTLAWVVSVMLPPMAIFFPLFTLLEDAGYLPRIAFNMDHCFKRCCAHGKQSLTMCMGFGCNACAVTGCRIIDSPRERLIAILTNNFVPCNGRFPTLIAIISMFFAGQIPGAAGTLVSALLLTGMILIGILTTLLISRLLSKTILKGVPSSFALELPPYRRPQFGQVIIRSVLDRTIFVLGRAVLIAAPAGLLIWILANTDMGGQSVLSHCTEFLDPFARLIGLDGVILMAFILGFPANEIVIPIIIMTYMAAGSLTELSSAAELHTLLTAHGWTVTTAVCTMLFSLMHFPCGTTCWTIKKETQSWKWTALAFLLPLAAGIVVCFAVSHILNLFF